MLVLWISVLLAGLVPHEGILAATISPPPIIRTLNSSLSADGTAPQLEVDQQQIYIIPQPEVEQQKSQQAEATKEQQKPIVEDAEYWRNSALNQLKKTIEAAKKRQEHSYGKKAKNIIIFLGDGMGVTTITAGRIFKGQFLNRSRGEEEMLAFDEFPYTGMAKTYTIDRQVPDSAGTATALFCGIKTATGAIGMDNSRSKSDASLGHLSSIMDWGQQVGKRTGIVTTTGITHATPAATYAHVYNRDWECDAKIPSEADAKYQDIARQLVENAPGNRFNVIMGGGLSAMGARDNEQITTKIFHEGTLKEECQRRDGRNLVQEWLNLNATNAEKKPVAARKFVQTLEQLKNVDVKQIDYLMGLFRNNHMSYSLAKEEAEPTLKEMVEAAIGVLDRGKQSKGFVLMVEGGRIDHAHHQNFARAAMREVYEFDLAIEAALKLTNEEETLIIVTADHSHAFTMNGYASRGNDILGFANAPTKQVYETLSYANGPGYWDHLANNTSPSMWLPLELFSTQQRSAHDYRHQAMMPLGDETHGGEDVVVFANGPGSSLIRGVFEQNYVGFVMSYAGCMGPAKDFDRTCSGVSGMQSVSGVSGLQSVSIVALGLVLVLMKFLS